VTAGRRKLKQAVLLKNKRVNSMNSATPQTKDVVVGAVEASLRSKAPFLEDTLLTAFKINPKRVEEAVLATCNDVLAAPIKKNEYEWLKQYVLPSSVWLLPTADDDDQFMFGKLLAIAREFAEDIKGEMNAIYEHLQDHKDWHKVLAIKNQTVVQRQDDESVGLLTDDGVRAILEAKQDDIDEREDLMSFIETNLAVSMLTTTASEIDSEFQNTMRAIMGGFGDYTPAPIKRVDRCVSKIENDYKDEAFPKAAKLLDLVRCSVSFNTVSQLLAGYEWFMKCIEGGRVSMKLARVKNGFLANDEGGYRDLKINVIFQSTMNPEVRMICEVQLILNQYLYEKKKMHKLYSIIRDEIYYKIVVLNDEDAPSLASLASRRPSEQELELKALQFEPILNAQQEFGGEYGEWYFKGGVQPDQGLLSLISGDYGGDIQCHCVDMESKKEVFKTQCHGYHTNHWISIENRLFLSAPTTKNVVSFFAVDSVSKQLLEEESLKVVLPESDVIDYVEFDSSFENVFILKNKKTLEKRPVGGGDEVALSLTLEKEDEGEGDKNLSLSDDGKFCAIGGGYEKKMWHLIDIATQQQYELESKALGHSMAPCFLGGGSQLVAVGGNAKIEIWDLDQREAINVVEFSGGDQGDSVNCMCSAGDLLAVGSEDKKIRVYHTGSWELLYSEQYEMVPVSLHLDSDLRYLTVGGSYGEKCVVLKIT